ncbi:hypothetical protein [Beijerinckia sp. L45]|uniref:hypothetical protein n=1 Tax=Beijerinckia sp. L45 TaxID=1641855 RepID=UPI00131C39E2|nr:hypothetical protein [Beijerinckia sp. L45]
MLPNALKTLMTAAALGLAVSVAPVSAADLGSYVRPPVATYGVACEGPEVQTFPSVYLGHFAGGASQYSGPGGSIFLDWRDEKLCFPSRRTCNRWVSSMRRDFHHPEGDYTCLTIR